MDYPDEIGQHGNVGVVYELLPTTQFLPPTIKIEAKYTAASRVLPTQSRSCRMGEKWPDARYQGLTRPKWSPSAASLIRSIRFTQVVPPYMRCVRVTAQEIEQAMIMNAKIGIDRGSDMCYTLISLAAYTLI